MSEPGLPEKVLAVHRELDRARVPHAFGGALALAYYAEPRATIDIDVNLFVSSSEHPRVAEVLQPVGVDAATDSFALERDGQCRIWFGRTPLDLFYAYDELHTAMAKATRRVPFADERIPILAPEHLLICKAVFDRTKDWLDIEQMVAFVDGLDVEAIERELARLVGVDDQRLARFRELVRSLR
jgi:hypothetical protein